MKNKIEWFLQSPSYPILLSIYPVLTLFSTNTYQVSIAVLFRPLVIFAIFSVLLFGGMRLIFREWHKAAFVTALILLFLTSFGHIENFLENKNVRGAPYYIFSGWLIVFVFLILLKNKFKGRFVFSKLAPSINLMAIILLLYPIAKGVQYYVIRSSSPSSKYVEYQPLDISSNEQTPDIYYIIPDGYARSDILQDAYDYNNSEFITELRMMGFYIAECSQSNYPNTGLSLTSALNMHYIQDLNKNFVPGERELFYLFSELENNLLKRTFDAAGYKTVAFASGFSWAEMKTFDVFLTPPPGPVNEFEVMFLKTTFIRFFDDIGFISLDNIVAERYRERTRLVFDSFSDLVKMSGPKFVFVHIIAPHPPFGFDADGNSVPENELDNPDGYINQAKFVSKEIIKSVEILITQSDTPPIIIIQGDHGLWNPRQDWQFGILNAYYLPGHVEALYPTITPVNTFRLIFNEYFGTSYPLLPDNSFYSKLPYIYNFSPVENECAER